MMPLPIDTNHRLEALRSALEAQNLAGALLSRPEHVFYFTGHRPGPAPAFLIVLPDRCTAVATAPLPEIETVTYSDYDIHTGWSVSANAASALAVAIVCSGLRGKRVGIELDHIPALFAHTVRPHIGEPSDVAALLWQLRRIKDEGELAQIEANVAANDRAFAAVQAALHPGITDTDLWAVVVGVNG